MSETPSQQKVMAAIMTALKNGCDCESCQMLRDVADSLIAQLKASPTGASHGKTARGRGQGQ